MGIRVGWDEGWKHPSESTPYPLGKKKKLGIPPFPLETWRDTIRVSSERSDGVIWEWQRVPNQAIVG